MTNRANAFVRWVRLKHKAKATAQQAEAISTSAEAAAEHPEIRAAMREPFDPASLPSIGSIAADTDIVAFLKSDLPTELTRAALRRTWTSDPRFAISSASRKASGNLRVRRKKMRAFAIACLTAVVIAVGAAVILHSFM